MTDNQHKSSNRRSRKSAKSAGNKAKGNLINFTRQLASLGNLQQVIVINMQKELENLDR